MKKVISIFTALIWFSGVAMAQEPLTLKEAINYAIANKVEAKKARLDVENSEYQIEEVRANALPQVNASGGLTYNALLQQMALNMGGQTMVIRMGQPWQTTAAVQLDQQIFNMAVFQGLKAAKSTREFYIINAELTEEQVVEKVASSYYEVFKTKSQIKTIESTIANTRRVRDILQSLFDNGLAKKIDLDRMNVALNNLVSSKQQLENALALQQNALKYLIGMDINKPIVMPDNSFDIDEYISLTKVTDVSHRTEVKLLEKQGELLQLNKKSIEAQRYPSLAFSANYGYMGIGENLPYFAGAAQGVNWSNFSALSLNLRIPIFAGFRNRALINQADIQIRKFEADYQDAKLGLSLAIENAYTQINNSLMTLNSQKANMNLAREVLSNVENNYKNGLASLTDLLDAETSYADAQNNYTNALMDYKLAEIQLVKAQGRLIPHYTK